VAVWDCEGYLLGSTGLNKQHAAYFASAGAREGWMKGKQIGSFTEYSMVRPDAKSINAWAAASIHVDMKYDDTTACDYVMFRTPKVHSRWFYGMVKHREYVNELSTRIWFDIDYYSTFADVIEFGACFVERHHVKLADDWQGNYPSYKFTQPEPYMPQIKQMPHSQWNTQAASAFQPCKPQEFVIFATTDETGKKLNNLKYLAGAPTACETKHCFDLEQVRLWLELYAATVLFAVKDALANIVGIVWAPKELNTASESPVTRQFTTKAKPKSQFTRADNLSIKNAKCMTFPYYFVSAKSANGEQMIIKPQEVPGEDVYHNLIGCGGLDGHYQYSVLRPGAFGREDMIFINMPDYPQLACGSDAFGQWASKRGAGTAMQGLMGVIGLGVGIGSGNPGIALAGAAGLTMAAGEMAGSNALPDTLVGKQSGMLTGVAEQYKIYFYEHMPEWGDLQALDDYFECFGYHLGQFMTPDPTVRSKWTYIKTKNAVIKGKCPHEGIKYVQEMLNEGCTFWNAASCEPGKYESQNP